MAGRGRRPRPAFLFAECAVLRLGEKVLREDPALAAFDPGLDSLINVNTPGEYAAAQARRSPEVTVVSGAADGPRTVYAAAAATGPDEPGMAIINGDVPVADGQKPLVAGDSVVFIAG